MNDRPTGGVGANDVGDAMVLRWSRHPRCVGLARGELRKALDGWELAGIQDSALLVLSELLTNAVRHAHASPGREIETRYLRTNGGVRIEVHDAAGDLPRLMAVDLDSPSGRGLALVAALADRWDVSARVGPGKSVWVELHAEAQGGMRDGS